MFKKNIAKFTIQFDLRLPEHQRAVEMLSTLGRNKATFIARLLSLRAAASLFAPYNGLNETKGNIPSVPVKTRATKAQVIETEPLDTSIFDEEEEDNVVLAYEPLIVESKDPVAENLKKLGIF